MIPGWSRDDRAYLVDECAHVKRSREMLVWVQHCPYALCICTWCGKTRLRAVDPSSVSPLRTWSEAA